MGIYLGGLFLRFVGAVVLWPFLLGSIPLSAQKQRRGQSMLVPILHGRLSAQKVIPNAIPPALPKRPSSPPTHTLPYRHHLARQPLILPPPPPPHPTTTPTSTARGPRPRPPPHQLPQPQVLPRRLPRLLRRLGDAKRRVLVRHHVVLVLGVDGLQVRRDVDVVGGELVLAEIFKQVRVARGVHVHVGEGGVFVLFFFVRKVLGLGSGGDEVPLWRGWGR